MFVVDYVEPGSYIEISKPMVCKSAAGYYVGTLYREGEYTGPNERLSKNYYYTEEDAVQALKNGYEHK